MMKNKLDWKVNTPELLKEIIENNDELGILRSPIMIFKSLLAEVANRAIEINDLELNKLMLRLSLYEVSNPESKDFDLQFVNNYLDKTIHNIT